MVTRAKERESRMRQKWELDVNYTISFTAENAEFAEKGVNLCQ